MYTVRRTNEIDGSGWGVHVSWTERGRNFDLFVWGVQYPLGPRTKTHILLRNVGQATLPWNPYNLYLDLNTIGRLGILETFHRGRKQTGRSRTLTDGPDMLPFYRMAQKVRQDGGPGYVLVDWLIDLNLPEITACLAYGFTPTESSSAGGG